jgi:hypothetical protein
MQRSTFVARKRHSLSLSQEVIALSKVGTEGYNENVEKRYRQLVFQKRTQRKEIL